MPAYATSEPIAVDLRLDMGVVRITAAERADTVVEVRPTSADSEDDQEAAERILVDYSDGELQVRGKRGLFRGKGSVDVAVHLPTGSYLTGAGVMVDLYVAGELGECVFKTDHGDLNVERTGGRLQAMNGYGDVTVTHAAGDTEIQAGSGNVRVGTVGGALTLKIANGGAYVREVAGHLKATSGNGHLHVGRTHSSVTARSGNGDIRIKEVRSGLIDLRTSLGQVEVGIAEGAAAWLDENTKAKAGSVHNNLGSYQASGPDRADLSVRAVSGSGDIVIRHA